MVSVKRAQGQDEVISNDDDSILVSVCCITYNQAPFVRDMLDGILEQETDFRFEVLVHDDASTDGTLDILREYESRHSNIRVISEDFNRHREGINYINDLLVPLAKGRYIAICEGDDFWTDTHKLQVQTELLESHPDYSLSVHGARVISGDNCEELGVMGLGDSERTLTPIDLVSEWHIPTASFVFRRSDAVAYREAWRFKCPVGDFPRAFYLSTKGKVHYFPKQMSVYRYGVVNSWTSLTSADEVRLLDKSIQWIDMLGEIDSATENKFHQAMVESAKPMARQIYVCTGAYQDGGALAYEAAFQSSRLEKLRTRILRVLWLCGYGRRRVKWSGKGQIRLVRRSGHGPQE